MLGSSARAAFIDFNPTGTGATPVMTIGGIDLAPGNALARGAVPLAVGKTFELDFQSSVSGFSDANGRTTAPPGLATSYQITAVGSFTEVVTSLGPNNTVTTFALAPNQASNSFFELYYNPAVVANDLAGTGFNQGTLILSGKPTSLLANVGTLLTTDSTGSPTINQPMDQFLSNHYPGINTVSASGSAMNSVDVTFFNPAFFKTAVSQLSFNSSLVTPFGQVSPSAMFTNQAGGGSPNVIANTGSINGLTGPDFQFQADPNFSFLIAPIPEPASFVLASLGFAVVLCISVWMRK
jgi:hypothetical protein